jgi:hypothetical protein
MKVDFENRFQVIGEKMENLERENRVFRGRIEDFESRAGGEGVEFGGRLGILEKDHFEVVRDVNCQLGKGVDLEMKFEEILGAFDELRLEFGDLSENFDAQRKDMPWKDVPVDESLDTSGQTADQKNSLMLHALVELKNNNDSIIARFAEQDQQNLRSKSEFLQ